MPPWTVNSVVKGCSSTEGRSSTLLPRTFSIFMKHIKLSWQKATRVPRHMAWGHSFRGFESSAFVHVCAQTELAFFGIVGSIPS